MLQTIQSANLIITHQQWVALMPYLVLLAGAMLTLITGTLHFRTADTRKRTIFLMTVVTLVLAIVFQSTHWSHEPTPLFNSMMSADYFSSFFNVLLCGGTLLMLMGSFQYLEREGIHYSEFYSILLLSTFGMMVLSAATELLTIFIALETMSLGVYVLVGLRRRDRLANEASVKYFVMGGVAAAIFLYGTSMIYGALGTTKLSQISSLLSQQGGAILQNPILLVGVVLVLIGFLFKIAAVPFHMWTPDVYEGAPTVVTGYMSTVLKAAVFASMIRVFVSIVGDQGVSHLGELQGTLHAIVWWIALLTMGLGNIVALMQKNLKRLLAYSAIAHTGYLMMGLLAGPKVGYQGILVYLVAYTAMNIGAFTVLAAIGDKNDAGLNSENVIGLAHRNPLFAGALVVFLMSLGGLPPTAGFVGKYFLFSSALEAGETKLVLIAIAFSIVSVFYYMRIVVQMYMKEAGTAVFNVKPLVSMVAIAALVLCVLVTLKIGVAPAALLSMVRKAAVF